MKIDFENIIYFLYLLNVQLIHAYRHAWGNIKIWNKDTELMSAQEQLSISNYIRNIIFVTFASVEP